MLQRPRLVAGGIGLGLVVAAVSVLWWPGNHDAVQLLGDGSAPAPTSALSAGFATPFEGRMWPIHTMEQSAPMTALQRAWLAPIAVTAAPTLQVGEVSDLVIGLGANAGVGEISFTVLFDANVLQARVGTEGDLAAGAGIENRFMATISDAADRVEIRSAVSGKHPPGHGGSVAIVQFQAVAPGITSIRIIDVMVKDLNGTAMGSSRSPSDVPVIAQALPTPLAEAAHTHSVTSNEAPATEADTGD